MKKEFYSKKLNLQISDLKGFKTKAQIEKQYGGTDWQELTWNNLIEFPIISNGMLGSKTIVQQQEEDKQKKQDEIDVYNSATTTEKMDLLAKKIGLK